MKKKVSSLLDRIWFKRLCRWAEKNYESIRTRPEIIFNKVFIISGSHAEDFNPREILDLSAETMSKKAENLQEKARRKVIFQLGSVRRSQFSKKLVREFVGTSALANHLAKYQGNKKKIKEIMSGLKRE